jgi:hypothetical protein
MIVCYGVEGRTDAPIAERLIRYIDREPKPVSSSGGSSVLDKKILRWNQPSNIQPILVLRDWDQRDNAGCVPELLDKVLGGRLVASGLVIRVPVRSIESWLLADIAAFNSYFGTSKLPTKPDDEANPTESLVLACRKSKMKWVRDEIVPRPKSGRPVGTFYEPRIIDFAMNHWDPIRASSNSPSLARSLARLTQLAAAGVI